MGAAASSRAPATAWPRDFRSSPERVSGLSLPTPLNAPSEQAEADHDQERRQRGLAEPSVIHVADPEDGGEDHEADHEDDGGHEHADAALPEQGGIAVPYALPAETQS